jgi:hypothetical protein
MKANERGKRYERRKQTNNFQRRAFKANKKVNEKLLS